MKSLAKTETYEDALLLESTWIKDLLAQGLPLFNISQVEPSLVTLEEPARVTQLPLYDGKAIHHTASQIDEILDWYLMTGELPRYVSARQRYHYRHHPRLEDRRRLLQMKAATQSTESASQADPHPLDPCTEEQRDRHSVRLYPDLERER